ncbi:MAG: hypothetical protein EXR98_20270 [Gemmataceae bacterium]|nr:hypothetical protein [Gemmataceae bacterium]
MLMFKLKRAAYVLLASSLLIRSIGELHALAPPTPAEGNLNAETFAQIGKQIKPQLGESRWMEVPWFLDLHEAWQKAAAEGKPLFIYSSGGATGIGDC